MAVIRPFDRLQGKQEVLMCDGLRPMGGNSMRLESIARVIRSKNAGPCLLTFDVMLPDQAAFAYVTERAASLRRQVANATAAVKTRLPFCRSSPHSP